MGKLAFGVHGSDHANLIGMSDNAETLSFGDSAITTGIQLKALTTRTKTNSLSAPRRVRAGGAAFNTDDEAAVFKQQFIPVIRLNHSSSDKRLLSGLSADAAPIQIAYVGESDNGGDVKELNVNLVCLCTSVLSVGAGNQIAFKA